MSVAQAQWLGEYGTAAENLRGLRPVWTRFDGLQALRRCRALVVRGRFENGQFAPRGIVAAAAVIADALLDSFGC